ncbi:hypothetical protein ALP58_200082 [Pseudomonas savastanoi]|nr:hypothetical protein ALP58_200082 [Pseudomonas savastanoi]
MVEIFLHSALFGSFQYLDDMIPIWSNSFEVHTFRLKYLAANRPAR